MMKNPFRRILVREITECSKCGCQEEKIYETRAIFHATDQALSLFSCLLSIAPLFLLLWLIMLLAVCVWCIRSLLARKNLLGELKKRALKENEKLWQRRRKRSRSDIGRKNMKSSAPNMEKSETELAVIHQENELTVQWKDAIIGNICDKEVNS